MAWKGKEDVWITLFENVPTRFNARRGSERHQPFNIHSPPLLPSLPPFLPLLPRGHGVILQRVGEAEDGGIPPAGPSLASSPCPCLLVLVLQQVQVGEEGVRTRQGQLHGGHLGGRKGASEEKRTHECE